MQDGWVWADEESTSSPMEFARGDEDYDEEGEGGVDWEEEEDDEGGEDEEGEEDDEWGDEDEDDDDAWEEWEDEFDEDDDDSLGRKRSGRPEWI